MPRKKQPGKTGRVNKVWSTEELDLIRKWYGRVKTDEIVRVLGCSLRSFRCQCERYHFTLQARIYSTEPVKIRFQGKTHGVRAFRYSRKNGITTDKTVTRRPGPGRPRKEVVEAPKKERVKSTRRMQAEYRQRKADLSRQEAKIQPFQQPEGKKLTKVAPGLYKYV